MDVDKNDLLVYTDGSCKHKPRRGGIGVRIVHIDKNGYEAPEDICFGGYKKGSNNQMELKACAMGLKILLEKRLINILADYNKIILCCDSQYVCGNYKNARFNWLKKGWLNKDMRPISNVELWQELIYMADRIWKKAHKVVEVKWVQGHKSDIHNRAVDKLAKRSADIILFEPIVDSIVRRKTVSASTAIGSVRMRSQDLLIHIIGVDPHPAQKLYRYRFGVIDTSSPYLNNADFVYYDARLKPGHHYIVTLNSDNKNPRIVDHVEVSTVGVD